MRWLISLVALVVVLASSPSIVSTTVAQPSENCLELRLSGEADYSLYCLATAPMPDPMPIPTATATATTIPTPASTSTPAPTSSIPPNVRVVPLQYSTIRQALEGIPQGHIVVLQAGVYREQAIVTTSGVTIMSVPGETVWIDGGCTRDYGIVVEADDVKIRDIGIRQTVQSSILIHLGKARTTVDGNTLQDFNCMDAHFQYAAGVAAWYAGSGHKITNNTITRRIIGVTAGQGNGIWFKSNSTDMPSGGGHTISDNVITGGYDGIGGETEGDPRGGFDRNTLITRNLVKNCWDDGIQVEGGGQNIVVSENRIEECGLGIAFATPLTGPLRIEKNVIVTSTAGYYGTIGCFKIGRPSTATIIVTDNTCTTTGDGFKQTNSGAGVWQFTNNRLNTGRYVIETTSQPGTVAGASSVLDYNCYYTTDPTRFVKWAGVTYASLTAFRSATGLEPNGRMGPC
jgi:hypothetical protein